jgi:hypothetical protein
MIFNTRYLSTFICLLCASTFSIAQSELTLISRPEIGADAQPENPILKFDLRGLDYLSDNQVDSSFQQNIEAQIDLKKTGSFFAESRAIVGSFSETKSSYVAVPELYVGLQDSPSKFISLGRQIHTASFVDSYYHLGLYNSYFTNDLINFTEQGLTGLHLQIANQFFGLRVGVHPLYFPNQGPQVREENGSLVSSNRWAPRPPAQFKFADQVKNIEYVIRDYEVSEIISNPGQVATFFVGSDLQRPYLRVSYAHHPINDIPLTRDTYAGALDSVGHVALFPVVTYHEVKSVDVNLDAGLFKSTLSYVEDNPENKVADENETLQSLNPLKIYGLYLAADLTKFFRRQVRISLALADIYGGEIKDLMSNGEESAFTFSTQRTQYRKPVTLAVASELFFGKSKAITSEISWTYDQVFQGSLVSAQFKYPVLAQMSVNLGFDFLGVENELSGDTANNFLSKNQANDRVYGGLQYVF